MFTVSIRWIFQFIEVFVLAYNTVIHNIKIAWVCVGKFSRATGLTTRCDVHVRNGAKYIGRCRTIDSFVCTHILLGQISFSSKSVCPNDVVERLKCRLLSGCTKTTRRTSCNRCIGIRTQITPFTNSYISDIINKPVSAIFTSHGKCRICFCEHRYFIYWGC